MTYDRRTVLQGSAGLAAAGLTGQAFGQGMRLRIGVVGGGIIGCSVAMHIAKAGADVVLFEKGELGSGATRNSLAWINPVTADEHYMRLRLLSMTHWRDLDRELRMGVVWSGSISWTKGEEKGKTLKAKAELLRNLGQAPEMLADAAAVTSRDPAITTGGDVSAAMLLTQDGHVDPVFAARTFAAAAKRQGARVLERCEVTAVDCAAGKIVGVATTRGKFPLDRLVFVGGTDTPHLMSMLDVPFKLAHAPGLVVHTTPQPIATRRTYEASGVLEFLQYSNGQFVTSFTEGPPDLPQHKGIREHRMDYPVEELREWHGQMLINKTAELLPAIGNAKPEKILLGFRPMPLDKMPVVGPVPGRSGCYMVVTHSGVTLSALLGDHVAREVVHGTPMEMLAPYRPDRFIVPAKSA